MHRAEPIASVRAYLIAVLCVVMAAAGRLALQPLLGYEGPLLLFVLPVIGAAVLGGLGPGLLATVLGAAVASVLFLEPFGSLGVARTPDVVRLLLYLMIGVIVSWLVQKLHDRKSVAERDRETLRRSEERFHLLVNAATDYAIFMLGTDGTILTWNAGAERLKGYRESEIVGRHFSRFYTDFDREEGKPPAMLKEALAKGVARDRSLRVRRDGSTFLADVTIFPIRAPSGEHRGFAKITRDVSEQESLAEAHHSDLEQLRLLIEGIRNFGITLVGTDGRFKSWNPGVERVLGYGAKEFVGLPFHAIFTVEDIAAGIPEEELRQAVEEGRAPDHRWHVKKDGSLFWATGTTNPLRDRSGRLVGYAKVIGDATASKLAETRLAESEDRFRQLVTAMPEAFWIQDLAKDRIVYASPAFADLFGVSLLEIDEDPATDVAFQHLDASLRPFFSACDSEPHEVRVKHPVKGRRWLRCRCYRIGPTTEGSDRIACIAADVTDERTVRDALAETVEETRSIVDNVVDGIITIDERGTILRVNPATERIFGYAAAEMIGRNITMLMPPVYADHHDEFLRRFLATGEARIIGKGREVAGKCKDGRVFPMDLAVGAFRHKGERRFTGVVRDVSDRKQYERDMAEAKDAAEAANRSKSAFLANMSHEIRTPLNAILGFSELMLDPELTFDDRVRYVGTVRRNGQLLAQIIDDILDLSKVEAGQMPLESLSVDVPAMIEDVLKLFEPKAREKGIELAATVSGSIPERIASDPTRLKQILVNIVGNAVKFTAKGRVEVRASLLDGASPRLELLVTDTGRGISPEQARSLFQPFSQADASTTRYYGGTGLGLTLSRKLAQLLGGDVTLERSALGEGSSFAIRVGAGAINGVPRITSLAGAPEPKAPPSPIQASIPRFEGAHILVAEDAPDNQALIRKMLSLTGARVTIVGNGRLAVDEALANGYDLVLMDIQMPLLDGYEATTELREKGYTKPIVALTAHAMLEERTRMIAAGCDDHLSKPINYAQLLETLQRLLAPERADDQRPKSTGPRGE